MGRGTWHPNPLLSCILTDIIIVKLGNWFHLSCRCESLKLHSVGLCHISSVNFPLAGVQNGAWLHTVLLTLTLTLSPTLLSLLGMQIGVILLETFVGGRVVLKANKLNNSGWSCFL